MTKLIHLTQNRMAIVDDEDYDWLMQWKWYFHKGYAQRSIVRRKAHMHRIILNAPQGMEVDHINGNGLDNRRANLRLATRQQNGQNQRKAHNKTSRFKGVTWNKRNNKWQCAFWMPKPVNKYIYLGLFSDEIEAAKLYDRYAREHFGEFARLNFPDSEDLSLSYQRTAHL